MTQRQRGTFADLYDTEQRVRVKRPGRPRRETKRKQFTLYLTPEQEEILSDLHYALKKQFRIDRSDIAGFAIELLGVITKGEDGLLDFQNFESLKVYLSDKLRSR